MTLTKEIRKDLAAKLTAKAIEKHAPAMTKKVKTLNTKFTEVHARHLASLIPEVPESSWNKMIQLHTMTGRKSVETTVYPVERDDKGRLRTHSTQLGGHSSTYKVDEKVFNQLLRAMSGKWDPVFSALEVRVASWNSQLDIRKFTPRFDRVLPAFATDHHINLRGLEPENIKEVDQLEQARIRALAPLVKQVSELSAEFMSILTQALDYHEKVSDLLDACRTEKQLADLFPEAAAMLPQRAKKAQPVVPVELAKNVRRMLAEGVPA